VYYGDLAGAGVVDIVEAEYEPELNALAPRRYRDALTAPYRSSRDDLPPIKPTVKRHLEAVLGEARARARVVEATTLATMAFLNRGDHFE